MFLPWFAAAALWGQPAATVRSPAPLGLSRLSEAARPGQAVPLAAGRFAVDALAAGGAAGVARGRRDEADYLALEPGREWSRPLRGPGNEVAFVSFQAYASSGSVIDIGGVRLGVTLSPTGGNLQLMYDDSTGGTLQWKALNLHVGAGRFDGRTLAALPTLTLRLDPASNTWDLFSGSRLVADQLPAIAARRDVRQFTLRAGGEGAWLIGLVMADENPLFSDANANGIDDTFERQRRGALLSATASPAERRVLALDWREFQRRTPPPALFLKRPLPDRALAATPPR
jgi:hypothetical protein